jgi:hypothetical protein
MDKLPFAFPNRSVIRVNHVLCAALWLALLPALPGSGQNSPQQPPLPNAGQPSQHSNRMVLPDLDQTMPSGAFADERRVRLFYAALHKSMVADADKLLKLASELNAETSRPDFGSLTPAQLRKVAEIEKLAHSVKEKMRNTTLAIPLYPDTLPPGARY